MIYKHNGTGVLYRVLGDSFDVSRQEPHKVYINLATGEIFNREINIFLQNFSFVSDPQLHITPKNSKMNEYYIQDKRDYVGNCILWWGKESRGYTCHLKGAQRYSEADAQAICGGSDHDLMWPCEYIDSIASLTVDSQDMKRPS